MKKGDRLSLRISHLEPEKRRVGFTQRWGTDAAAEGAEGAAPNGAVEPATDTAEALPVEAQAEPAPEADAGEKTE